MKRALLALAVVLLALLILPVLAPATWLDTLAHRHSRGLLTLAEARGTVWQGSATVQAILPSGRVETLDTLAWRFDPWALLNARLRLTARSQRDGQVVLDAVLAPGTLTVTRLRLDLPAALLEGLSPTLRAAGVRGRLGLSGQDLRFDGNRLAGNAELLWRDAGSALSPVHPLGNYKVAFQGAGNTVDFTLTTLDGALHLGGAGQWRPDRPLAFEAQARPRPEQAARMAPLLRILGKENGDGSYRIRFDHSAGLAGG